MRQLLPSPERRFERLASLCESGQRLRALELALGWTRQFRYSQQLWQRVGALAAELGHRDLAALGWFLGGVRGAVADPLIEAWLERLHRRPDVVWRVAPAASRLPLSEYPPVVRADLEALGVQALARRPARKRGAQPRGGWVISFLAGLAMLLFVMGVLNGLRAAWHWFVA